MIRRGSASGSGASSNEVRNNVVSIIPGQIALTGDPDWDQNP
jgi:hypothetical protein